MPRIYLAIDNCFASKRRTTPSRWCHGKEIIPPEFPFTIKKAWIFMKEKRHVLLLGISIVGSVLVVSGCQTPHDATRETVTKEKATAADNALGRRAEILANDANGNPAQEMANMILYEWQYDLIRRLKGEDVEGDVSLTDSRKQIKSVIKDFLEPGPTWPVLRSAKIPYAKQAPKLDGKLNDSCWENALRYQGLYAFNTRAYLQEPKTEWKILWDENYLYFSFQCDDPDIIAPKMKRDDAVFSDDCVEMFILPEFSHGLYWEIVISPTGSIYDGFNSKKFKGWGSLARKELNVDGLKVGIQVDGTPNRSDDQDKEYTVEVAVPFKSLPGYTRGNRPQAGDILNVMLVRLDRDGKQHKAYSFQPLLNWGHNIWNHARVTLQKSDPQHPAKGDEVSENPSGHR